MLFRRNFSGRRSSDLARLATSCGLTPSFGSLSGFDLGRPPLPASTTPCSKFSSHTRGPRLPLSFNFYRVYGSVVSWPGLAPDADGRTRIAVNLRLADPDAVADARLLRFDGLHSFEDLATDGRRVRDVWF